MKPLQKDESPLEPANSTKPRLTNAVVKNNPKVIVAPPVSVDRLQQFRTAFKSSPFLKKFSGLKQNQVLSCKLLSKIIVSLGFKSRGDLMHIMKALGLVNKSSTMTVGAFLQWIKKVPPEVPTVQSLSNRLQQLKHKIRNSKSLMAILLAKPKSTKLGIKQVTKLLKALKITQSKDLECIFSDLGLKMNTSWTTVSRFLEWLDETTEKKIITF